MTGSVKKMIAVPLAAAALYATPAKADLITQYAPDYNNPGTVRLAVELENNDDGAVYNSYDLPLFYSLSLSLWNLPQNQASYTSIDDMTGDWSLTLQPDPVGEINNKWQVNTATYNPVQITHFGIGYEQWLATQQNPNQDMMALTLSIPTSQLDGNGNGWSPVDSGDYTIGMNTSPTPNMGIGRNGGFEWAAQGYEYNVNIVPEPSTIALLGLGAAGVATLSVSGLLPGSTNRIMQASEVSGPWSTSMVFVATSTIHSVALAFTNDSEFFSAVVTRP